MNKSLRNVALTSALLLAISLTTGRIYFTNAQSGEDGSITAESTCPMFRKGITPLVRQLDEDLREELLEVIQTMRDEGASYVEIREHIQSFLEENGVARPKRPEISEERLELYKQFREDVNEYAKKRARELGLELSEKDFFWRPLTRFHGLLRGKCFNDK